MDHSLAVDTDTKLASLYERACRIHLDLVSAADHIHHLAGDHRDYDRATQPWKMALEVCLEKGPARIWDSNSWQKTCADLERDRALLRATHEEEETLEAIWREHRWSRFFLVISSAGGHIHSSRGCATCHPTTRFGWLPDISGLTEADAVAAHGARLCTVCFPSAPVEWTNANELERAAKAAKFCPGSGRATSEVDRRVMSPRGRCAGCGSRVSVTSTGKARQHKSTPDKPAA